MHLKREGLKRYFEEYEKYMAQEFKHPVVQRATFRKIFQEQAHRLAKTIRQEEEYIPFSFLR